MSCNGRPKRILVVGGGICGITAAIEASEVGCDVVLVEKEPYLGGRVARSYQYFPKLCPPTCGLEMHLRRIRTSPRIRCLTLSEVEKIAERLSRLGVTRKEAASSHARRYNEMMRRFKLELTEEEWREGRRKAVRAIQPAYLPMVSTTITRW